MREIPWPYVAVRLPDPRVVARELGGEFWDLPGHDKFDLIHDYAIDHIKEYGILQSPLSSNP